MSEPSPRADLDHIAVDLAGLVLRLSEDPTADECTAARRMADRLHSWANLNDPRLMGEYERRLVPEGD